MTKIVINPSDLQDKKTSLYRKDGNIIYQLLPYTTADQVELADKRNVQTAITKLITDVGTAQSTANTAKSTADTALSTANTAKTIANTVKAEVENETTGLAATKNLANTANTNANTAISNAATALSTANTAKSTADSLSSSVNNDTTGLSATREIANTAKNAIDTHKAKKDNPHEVTKAQVGLGNIPNAISSAIDSNSESQLATSKAVKIAYDKAIEAASSASSGSSSASSATETANTALSTANSALSAVNGKVSKAGDTMTGILSFKANNIDLSVVANKSNDYFALYNLLDKNNNNIISLTTWYWQTNSWHTIPYVQTSLSANILNGTNVVSATLGLFAYNNGLVYVTVPDPSLNDYSKHAVNMKALKDYTVQVIPNDITLYLGGANASDTANIHAGRGLSSSMPFASFNGIMKFICTYLSGYGVVTVILQGNISTSSFSIRSLKLPKIIIKSDATKRTLTLTNQINVTSGCVEFNNININGTNIERFFNCLGGWGSAPIIVFGANVAINGSVTAETVKASLGGMIVAYNAITGTVTGGRRYYVEQGGAIYTNNRGEEAIPGANAGYKASDGIYR